MRKGWGCFVGLRRFEVLGFGDFRGFRGFRVFVVRLGLWFRFCVRFVGYLLMMVCVVEMMIMGFEFVFILLFDCFLCCCWF